MIILIKEISFDDDNIIKKCKKKKYQGYKKYQEYIRIK